MVQPTQELKNEIKELIIDTLSIPDVKPEDIKDEDSLFENNEIMELDSVDALEIVMALQRKYGVKLDDQNTARYVLTSINSISEFVAAEHEKK